MYGTPRRSVQNFLFASGIPATITLIAINVASFFVSAVVPGGGPFQWLAFTGSAWPQNFWTLITWPLVSLVPLADPIGILFAGFWTYWVAGSLERSWGTRTFLAFFVALSALTALTVWIGGRLLGMPVYLTGLWLALAAPTVAWCVLNPGATILFSFILPIRAVWLAWLTVVLTWYQMGVARGNPLLGLFALSGCAAAYWYARNGHSLHRGHARGPFERLRSQGGEGASRAGSPPLRFHDFDRDPPVGSRFNPVRGLRAWWQRRQLEKLWKRSGYPDPDEKNNRR